MPIHNFSDLEQLKGQLVLKELIFDPKLIANWAAVHLIFYRNLENTPPKLAMIRRIKNEKDPWSGHYAFPGGGVEAEEGLKEASWRETREEIGLQLKEVDYLGEFFRMQVSLKGKLTSLGISAHASLIATEDLPQLSPCTLEVD
jgi:8-oxo-dGTP pyrophosphatase MutT (NUDIX family)